MYFILVLRTFCITFPILNIYCLSKMAFRILYLHWKTIFCCFRCFYLVETSLTALRICFWCALNLKRYLLSNICTFSYGIEVLCTFSCAVAVHTFCGKCIFLCYKSKFYSMENKINLYAATTSACVLYKMVRKEWYILVMMMGWRLENMIYECNFTAESTVAWYFSNECIREIMKIIKEIGKKFVKSLKNAIEVIWSFDHKFRPYVLLSVHLSNMFPRSKGFTYRFLWRLVTRVESYAL